MKCTTWDTTLTYSPVRYRVANVLLSLFSSRFIARKKSDSVLDFVKGAHDAWSGWLCVLLVGVCAGVMAGVIDIGATWFTDLKFGVCPSALYLNKEQCCWSSNETVIDISGNCSQWLSWAEVKNSCGVILQRFFQGTPLPFL